MPVVAWWIGAGIVGLFGVGYAADKSGEAMDSATRLTRWLVIGGVVYVSYEAAKSAGAIK